jgi:hypothetical protein
LGRRSNAIDQFLHSRQRIGAVYVLAVALRFHLDLFTYR